MARVFRALWWRSLRLSSSQFATETQAARGGSWLAAAAPVLAQRLAGDVEVRPGFLSRQEEETLCRELEPGLRRLRYERQHWDGAIHGFRETEKLRWTKESSEILQRVRDAAFPPGVPQLSLVHVLDLEKSGYIKPHIDSIKFCGSTIAGLCLLSSSVMRLVSEENQEDWVDLLLERRCLYILRGRARYEFTHQILRDEDSFFNGQQVSRDRRISVICRNLPDSADPAQRSLP
ncbi:alpha-ketoglutarate-dependent dioxygenase alkB homolog 7, mitochondrial [Microcaecilia unicolor]|uniref:Alpha-ketoglutarate-dependent dioxygenase alkB homolog 7, mitochondrial n=1 Tax=Microcaecilia unicolor TaxID=1415580 RepID=A0A6P7XQU5_9AMPH|nr:alpha-ketoglutarate-dependent dioxygenase alkB homolog 7, mitochondrial [Microcaecilia unicolor]XP_030052784.1 alpha-ketoglutarate-dependent dioxygenase alkB homolog 7, mitochondrial [Microcaecilia unicolor]